MSLQRTAFGTSCNRSSRSRSLSCRWLYLYVECLVSGCTSKSGARLDMAAGEAASGATGATSTGWLESDRLKLCLDQEVPKVLWSSVGYQRPFGDIF